MIIKTARPDGGRFFYFERKENMEIIRPRTLSGFMELLPGKQAQLEKMMQILRDTYASYGFAALDTPAIEDARSCWPRAAARPRSRSTASKRAIRILPCALI